ncbi:MAG: prepilin-type N-terminal cleavage/methylation domain-containing protein [Planctomycetota bacterium]|nr:prepilin-type N-terminal cleavage/methylation domain-containing protein [Planctomycetota bacterium]
MNSQTNPIHAPKPGLTLVELVVVLVILAILATVAVSTVAPRVDQQRFESTQRLIQNVERAIYQRETNSDGSSFDSGFLVDLGGLPTAYDEGDGSLSLRQLMENTGFEPFSIRPADSITNLKDSDDDDVKPDSQVLIGTGWRGPYLKLPVGANSLFDAWGHPLRSPEPPSTPPSSHLRGPGDTDVTSAGGEIIGVRSLGKDNATGGSQYDQDLPSTASGIQLTRSQLFGTVTGTVKKLGTSAEDTKIIVQLFYPDKATGNIRVERATILPKINDGEFDVFSFEFKDNDNFDVLFPVGPRALRAYYEDIPDSSPDFSDGISDDPDKSQIRYFNLRSQNNHLADVVIP